MSSEACPFCGKTYKRLKSHLPHCKAAPSSKTPPTKHDVTVNRITSSSLLATASSKPAAKREKSTQTLSIAANPQSKKGKKLSMVSSAPLQSSSPAMPLKKANTSPSSQPLSLSSASLPSSKKRKQKLSEQIKAANLPSSTTSSLNSSPSQSLPPTLSKPQKKSLRALIEAAKSKQVSNGSLDGTRSASEDLLSGSTPFVADPLSSTPTAQKGTKTNPDEDKTHPASLSTEVKPKGASKMKVASKTKKAAPPPSTTKDTSSSLDSEVNESSARPHVRGGFWEENEGEVADLSVNKMLLKSGSGHQTRITLQDVKATLGRATSSRRSSRPSFLSQIKTTDDLSSEIRPQENVDSCLVETKTLRPDQLPCTSSQHPELQSLNRKSSKSKQVSLISLRHDGSSPPELTSPAVPLLPGHVSSRVSQATSPPHAVGMNKGLKVDHPKTGIPTPSPSLTQFSSPHPFRLTPQTLPARVETLRADDGTRLEVRKQNTADNEAKGALTQRSLGQVRLRELPEWLVHKTPGRPRDVVDMVQRGWQWYYKRYIDVKKGGVGGLGMLLAGYCTLSYIWSYPHIKRDRWRKYH